MWVSEIMLQQTRVAVVEERYEQFLRHFPNVRALAASPVEKVCEAWAGLGYYGRAHRLHEAAQHLMTACGGRIPDEAKALAELPGVGAYTAAAIASIAFGRRAPAIDGNVERVLARVLADSEVRRGRRSARLLEFAAALTDCDCPGDVNQALMDLGAIICTPRRPRCAECPLRASCRARTLGEPERFPPPKPARAKPRLNVAFAWVPTRHGLWLERRPIGRLWSGLWQLPAEEGPRARARLAARLNVELTSVLARIRHELSHRSVSAAVYGPVRPTLQRSDGLKPYPRPRAAPLSALARKAIDAVADRDEALG